MKRLAERGSIRPPRRGYLAPCAQCGLEVLHAHGTKQPTPQHLRSKAHLEAASLPPGPAALELNDDQVAELEPPNSSRVVPNSVGHLPACSCGACASRPSLSSSATSSPRVKKSRVVVGSALLNEQARCRLPRILIERRNDQPFPTSPKMKWLSPREAAKHVGLSVDHLARLRVQGGGPRFAKTARGRSGAIRYPDTELDAWMSARLRSSTSDGAA